MSNLNIYGLTVQGRHHTKLQQRFFGAAPEMNAAIQFAWRLAVEEGWEDFDFVDISVIGNLNFLVSPPDDDSFIEELQKCKA
jgi:hypothetical protein